MKVLTILFLGLSYVLQAQGALGPGKKSYNTINENGAHIIQETIEYEEDKVVTFTTPQHHGLDFTKTVYDKESNYMMEVFLDRKECVINYQPVLQMNLSKAFENLKAAEGENTYESPIDGKGRKVEKLILNVYIHPDPIPLTSLPSKFQKHCPPNFTVYKAHMVDPQRATPEDPLDFGQNITAVSDAFDYQEPSTGRVKRACQLANGSKITYCHAVTSGICDGGCRLDHTRFQCDPATNGRSCHYLLWDCGQTLRGNGCIKHLTTGSLACKLCCINKSCGYNMGECKGMN